MNDPAKRSDIKSGDDATPLFDESAEPSANNDSIDHGNADSQPNDVPDRSEPDGPEPDGPEPDDEKMDVFGLTDIGHRRETNQDHFLIARLNKSIHVDASSLQMQSRLYGRARGHVIMVADGMGGHAGGARASELAIRYLVSRLLETIRWHFEGEVEEDAFIRSLQNMLHETHSRILIESSNNLENRGMGTTCTMAYVVDQTMYVVHAGDSRCYLVSKNDDRSIDVRQITTDHTMARRMVESGGLAPEEEASSRWSNVLWNVLGGTTDSDVIADVHRVELSPGDTVILCSDGLYRYLEESRLGDIVSEHKSPEAIATALVNFALQCGGEDNVTSVVLQAIDPLSDTSAWQDDDSEDILISDEDTAEQMLVTPRVVSSPDQTRDHDQTKDYDHVQDHDQTGDNH